MPIYTFKCTEKHCGHSSDKLKDMNDRNAPISCSKCGSTSFRVTSLPSPPKFNGQGWTDKFYRKDK